MTEKAGAKYRNWNGGLPYLEDEVWGFLVSWFWCSSCSRTAWSEDVGLRSVAGAGAEETMGSERSFEFRVGGSLRAYSRGCDGICSSSLHDRVRECLTQIAARPPWLGVHLTLHSRVSKLFFEKRQLQRTISSLVVLKLTLV